MNREKLKSNFEAHRFHTSFFDSREEAAAYLKEKIHGQLVGFGGSMTVKEMELDQILGEENEIVWHWLTSAQEARLKARDASVYILSANGVSETGELVNIDGTGNRLAASLFGPERVYYVIGKNKIEPDLDSAIRRARNVAAVKNAMRFQKKTPCVAAGGDRCHDCLSPERICSAMLILERPCQGMEVELVFIDEELGY